MTAGQREAAIQSVAVLLRSWMGERTHGHERKPTAEGSVVIVKAEMGA